MLECVCMADISEEAPHNHLRAHCKFSLKKDHIYPSVYSLHINLRLCSAIHTFERGQKLVIET